MTVFIRDTALADLEDIYEWISRDRPDAAVAVIERIFESLDCLAIFPLMGRPGLISLTHEWVVPGIPFIVVYQIDAQAQELQVIAIFHSRQDRDLEP